MNYPGKYIIINFRNENSILINITLDNAISMIPILPGGGNQVSRREGLVQMCMCTFYTDNNLTKPRQLLPIGQTLKSILGAEAEE